MFYYFECRVTYDKTLESGAIKQVTESYLVEAMSFTEAEARITQEMQQYITGEFTVSAVNRRKFERDWLVDEYGAMRFYIVKSVYITIDEKTMKEKRKPFYTLVQSGSCARALQAFARYMEGSVTDYEIVSVAESRILDVFTINDNKTEVL